MNAILEKLRGGLIVSCQAPAGSPLARPEIIAALAETAEQNGAVGLRIDSPEHVRAVKERTSVPVLGIYKIVTGSSEVYITPTFDAAKQIIAAGADLVALDATPRPRPNGESCERIVSQIRSVFGTMVMADVAVYDDGMRAAEIAGVDVVSTTLSGYTAETNHLKSPDFELVERLASNALVPVICEGRLRSVDDVQRAFDCGAFAVVVGGAITGVDQLVQQFASATPCGSTAEFSKAE
jgi:N-acylglucosamine-6-phosphate 2-epimerase